jgi:hypothetical protein
MVLGPDRRSHVIEVVVCDASAEKAEQPLLPGGELSKAHGLTRRTKLHFVRASPEQFFARIYSQHHVAEFRPIGDF